MLRNYLKIALRNLRRHAGYAFLNITGLAVGMACCLIIVLFVRDELSYDRFHENADRIYRITSDWGDFSVPATNAPFVRRFETDFPEIEVARVLRYGSIVSHEDKRFREDQIFYVTPSFFEVFSFRMHEGDAARVLTRPYTAVVTPDIARKYFGDANPVGQTLRLDNELDLEITGVVAPAPEQSHFHYSILVSWATLDALEVIDYEEGWGGNSIYTYLGRVKADDHGTHVGAATASTRTCSCPKIPTRMP